MRLPILMSALVLVCGCSGEDKSSSASSTSSHSHDADHAHGHDHAHGQSSFTSLDLQPSGKGGTATFDTGRARGVITIDPGLTTQFELAMQSEGSEQESTMTLTVAGKPLSLEGSSIRWGDQLIGPLSGDVKVHIKPDGLYVDGVKKSKL
jgi:hypothetical protein